MSKQKSTTKRTKKKEKKKKKYQTYKMEALSDALHAVSKGESIRSASKKFKVPFSTLRCRHKGIYASGKRSGPSTALTDSEEQRLVNWILQMGSKGFSFTKNMLLDSAQLLVKNLKRETPFTGGRPGRHWFEGFLKRHPVLSMRTLQHLNQKRVEIPERQLHGWHKEVQSYLKTKDLLQLDRSRIFNCDEIAFVLNPRGKKVIFNKQCRPAHNLVGGDDECSTALIAGNAADQMPPPMITFSYRRLPSAIIKKLPNGWGVGRSDDGWITGEMYYEFITNIFHPWCVQNNIQFPVVMFLDGYSSRITMTLSEFCESHGIELISLYPNSTHTTQPMDEALFRSLKNAWKTAVTNWKKENGELVLRRSNFAIVLKTALESMNIKKSLTNGITCYEPSSHSADKNNFNQLLNNEESENSDHKHVLKFIESSLTKDVIQLFKIAATVDENWCGEEKYSELFAFWLKCRKLSKLPYTSTNISSD